MKIRDVLFAAWSLVFRWFRCPDCDTYYNEVWRPHPPLPPVRSRGASQ